MARDSGGDQEWRRPIGQAEPWRFAESNAGPIDLPSVPRHQLGDGGQIPAEPRPFDEQYVADAKTGVGSARARYRRTMRAFWALRFGVIGSGLLVAVLSAAGAPVWTVASFGALAAALETIISTTNLQNRAVVRGLYADAVARELRTFSLKIEPYAGTDAITVLHNKLETLRTSASNTQFKLDQASGTTADA